MASDWNRLLERLLAADLTVSEMRLALALARSTLGYRRHSSSLGDRHLRDRAGLHGRSFEKARQGLIGAGLLDYEKGTCGRGHRSRYTLLLDEKTAPARAFSEEKKTAPERDFREPVKDRSHARKRPLQSGHGIGNRDRKSTAPGEKTLQARAVEAYASTGGVLELDEWRGALARHTTQLAAKGIEERIILAAAAELGRERAFPGYLAQRANELAEKGGPCEWEGLDRSRLTPKQLGECSCHLCAEWRVALTATSAEKAADVTPTFPSKQK
jgi:hypothetical protein